MAKRAKRTKPNPKPQAEVILRVTPPVRPRSVLPLGKNFPPVPPKVKRVKVRAKLSPEDQQKAAAIYYSHAHLFGA